MELGSMMHTMVWTYLTWINQDVGTTAKMANINLPARLSSTLMDSPKRSAFIECLKASKYLLPLCFMAFLTHMLIVLWQALVWSRSATQTSSGMVEMSTMT